MLFGEFRLWLWDIHSCSPKMVWQIVPCSRPHLVKGVIDRFRSQTYQDAKICLVVNGWNPEINVSECLKQMDAEPDLLLETEASPVGKAVALNHALDVLRGELVAIRDDDDIQGPKDLEEAIAAREATGAELVVKIPHYVKIDGVLWLFAEELANTWALHADGTPDPRISGSNMLFHTNLGIEFPLIRAVESRRWAKSLVDSGGRIWRTSVENYIWVRSSKLKHLWAASEAMVRYEYGMPEKGLGFIPARKARRFLNGTWDWVEPPTLNDLMKG